MALQVDRESLRGAHDQASRAEAAARATSATLEARREQQAAEEARSRRLEAFRTEMQRNLEESLPMEDHFSASGSLNDSGMRSGGGVSQRDVNTSRASEPLGRHLPDTVSPGITSRLEEMARAEAEARNESRRLQLLLAEQEVELSRGWRTRNGNSR